MYIDNSIGFPKNDKRNFAASEFILNTNGGKLMEIEQAFEYNAHSGSFIILKRHKSCLSVPCKLYAMAR